MKKALLLANVSIIVFSSAVYADEPVLTMTDFQANPSAHYTKVELADQKINSALSYETVAAPEQTLTSKKSDAVVQNTQQEKLSADLIVDFAKFSYSVDKTGVDGKGTWGESDKAIFNRLVNDGWILDPFNGTTGTASTQVESVSGLLAFKGDQVVIATRGTEMTNLSDWATNFRFSRSPIMRFFSSEETNKLGAITAQFFGGVDGEVANGFLQTHLSSWEYIKAAIIKYAASKGISTQDLQYTITGHSKGAAKAQLNALNLLTDRDLNLGGVRTLEESFILSKSSLDMDLTASIANLMGSGFYGMAKETAPQNQGNVEAVVFESPRVFSDQAAAQAEEIIGKEQLLRVENKGAFGSDPVIHLSPEFAGFKHIGTELDINNGTFIGRHLMGNVGEPAAKVIEEYREGTYEKPDNSISGFVTDLARSAYSTAANVCSSVSSAVVDGFTSVASKIWSFWG